MSGIESTLVGTLVSVAAIIAASTAIWKFRPTRWAVERLASAFLEPAKVALEAMMRRVVREETDDIRGQVFDNGNGSLADRLSRIEVGLVENRERGQSNAQRLADIEQADIDDRLATIEHRIAEGDNT